MPRRVRRGINMASGLPEWTLCDFADGGSECIRNGSVHRLRNSWAINQLQRGVSPSSVKNAGGWSSFEMLDRHSRKAIGMCTVLDAAALPPQALQPGEPDLLPNQRDGKRPPGTTDKMIIAARRKLINACKVHHAEGVVPPGVEKPDLIGSSQAAP